MSLVCFPIPLRSSTKYSASTICTIQLLVKVLLKLFSSAGSIETDNETKYGDDGMLELQVMDEKDEEEEEDLLADLDDDEREELMNNKEAICMMLNKVHLYVSIISLPLHSCLLLL